VFVVGRVRVLSPKVLDLSGACCFSVVRVSDLAFSHFRALLVLHGRDMHSHRRDEI
jgi:hypothetical protein